LRFDVAFGFAPVKVLIAVVPKEIIDGFDADLR